MPLPPQEQLRQFRDLQAYLGLDLEDAARLAALWLLVSPQVPGIVDRFYERVLRHPDAAGVFEDKAQVQRLKRTMGRWLEELLLGPHDADYAMRRRAIGRRHVKVGLAHRYMVGAMSVMQEELTAIAWRTLPGETAAPTLASIGRICALDLGLMTGEFMLTREEASLAELRGLILSQLPVLLILVDADGRLLGGAGSADSAEHGHWTTALPGPLVSASEIEALAERARISGEMTSIDRVDAVVDGHLRNYRVTVVPLAHELSELLIMVEELTGTVATEARLRRAETLAQLGALSAAVAHELRNPLAGISGVMQVLRGSLDEGDRRRSVLDKALDQIRRLDRLVTELLAFARPSAPKLSDLDLRAVVDATVDLVRLAHPGITFTIKGAGWGRGDPDHVQQVLLNLIENGATATDGQGTVAVEIRPGSIRVCDDGRGIPPELVERIFEPFYTTRTRGTGLGLAICRNLLEAMSGEIVLGSGPLGGACFEVRLPPLA